MALQDVTPVRGLPAGGTDRQTLRISGGSPHWRDSPNFFGRDYLTGDPADDASPGLAAAIAAMQAGQHASVGVSGGNLQLEQGEYRLTQTLDLTRFTGRIGGVGPAISPYYGTNPGRGTVLKWDGPADQPMIRVRNSRDVIFENIRLEGHASNIPSYGIEFYNVSGDSAGTNARLTVRDVHIGPYGWPVGSTSNNVKRGIGFTGDNANNDQYRIERVYVQTPTEWGLYIQNEQSVAGAVRHFVVNTPGLGGIYTAASMGIDHPEFYFCPVAIEMGGSNGNNANVVVTNVRSEEGVMFARTSPAGVLAVRGGYIQVGDTITGGQVFIDASPMDNFVLDLEDVSLAENTTPGQARIEIGPVSPYPGRFFVSVRRCREMHPDQLVFASGASMWASSPMSKGVVEWQTQHDNSLYQFRNELRTSGTGTRTTLDKTVWDLPISDAGSVKTVAPGVLKLVPMSAPASGEVGDMYMATGGKLMVCTVAGTPGTWTVVGAQT